MLHWIIIWNGKVQRGNKGRLWEVGVQPSLPSPPPQGFVLSYITQFSRKQSYKFVSQMSGILSVRWLEGVLTMTSCQAVPNSLWFSFLPQHSTVSWCCGKEMDCIPVTKCSGSVPLCQGIWLGDLEIACFHYFTLGKQNSTQPILVIPTSQLWH